MSPHDLEAPPNVLWYVELLGNDDELEQAQNFIEENYQAYFPGFFPGKRRLVVKMRWNGDPVKLMFDDEIREKVGRIVQSRQVEGEQWPMT